MTPKQMGKTIRALRKAKELSRGGIGSAADLSREYVDKIEAGRYDHL
jgi:transcriptional regulator with XRE-family HTH domain